jgi:hypothetical protein
MKWGHGPPCPPLASTPVYKEVEQLCLTVLNVTRLAPPPLLTLARLCMATAAVRISLNPVLLPALPLRR